MNDTPQHQTKPHSLITRTLHVRTGQKNAGEAAALRQGIISATEIYARPYTDVYLAGEDEKSATGWRRGAAICATATGAMQPRRESPRIAVGASLRRLFDQENPGRQPTASNTIVAQINSLPMLDLENAAATLALLIGRCSAHGIPVDFYRLGQTLSRWGRGTTRASRAVRNNIVSDFYQVIYTPKEKV